MDYISRIRDIYDGNIMLHDPYKGRNEGNIPEELYALLCISNGLGETMLHPKTGEEMMIAWIVYPYEMIVEQTAFFNANYGIKGVVFADDGAGDPYIIKPDGEITCFNGIDNEETRISDALSTFFK